MSAETTKAFIAKTVRAYGFMDKWNRDRMVAGLRREVAIHRCEASLKALQALGVDPSLAGGFEASPETQAERAA